MERKANRALVPKCGRCGYELTGLRVEEKCPECGTQIWYSHPSVSVSIAKGAREAQVWGRVAMCAMLFPFAALLLVMAWFLMLPATGAIATASAVTAIVYGRRVRRAARLTGIHEIGILAAMHGERMGYAVVCILLIGALVAAYLFYLHN